jgi:3-oxoacyl-[acyl-carrier-protein] synthase II
LRLQFLREYPRLDPAIIYGLSAGALAMEMSCLKVTEENSRAIGVKVGTGLGGGQSFEAGALHFHHHGRSRRLYDTVLNVMGNATAGLASLYFGLKGSSSTSMAACASSGYAITEACDKIKLGKAAAMLVIGTEASLVPFIIACFDSMGIHSGAVSRKPGGSLPFAADRDGFVLGEGAGAIVLAEAAWAAKNGLKPVAEILGYWENAGAAHMVQPNPRETAYCMEQAIAHANLTPRDIDYVNAHATATTVGDLAESKAICEVFGSSGADQLRKPYVNSTKALIGHTCGAAGVLELIVAILSLRDGVIHPMGDYDADPACLNPRGSSGPAINIVSRVPVIDRLRFALTNSFGFGDENASIVLGLS